MSYIVKYLIHFLRNLFLIVPHSTRSFVTLRRGDKLDVDGSNTNSYFTLDPFIYFLVSFKKNVSFPFLATV